MNSVEPVYNSIRRRIAAAAEATSANADVRLLAVSKGQSVGAIRALAALGQRAFGENYMQEARAKQDELANLALEWHLIGPLQSNKCREVAQRFDWLQSLDREKLIDPLTRHRPPERAALNVLIEVNIDDEPGKAGCAPHQVQQLAEQITAAPHLRLRGLMAIPDPHPHPGERRAAFVRLRGVFENLRSEYSSVDTLSMGMSEDFELAIAEGATMVRIGTALFGPRLPRR
ncbi:MAG: YggS family pyridoxal phosphate-dependent enzyme [Rhodanobacteraceae bacterium]